jgi:hypothetical protein
MQKANNQFNVLQNRLIHVLICAFRNEAVITVTCSGNDILLIFYDIMGIYATI